jgi:hypothetical protein
MTEGICVKHVHRRHNAVGCFLLVLAAFGLESSARAQLCAEPSAPPTTPAAQLPADPKLADYAAIGERCARGAEAALIKVKKAIRENGKVDEHATPPRDEAIDYDAGAGEVYAAARALVRGTDLSEADGKKLDLIKQYRGRAARALHAARSLVSPEKLEVFPFLGFAVDTFAASEVRQYLNRDVSGDSKTRETFGVWFQYPLYSSARDTFGLSIYGQTLHGVRSTEFNCDYSQPLLLNPKCKEVPKEVQDLSNTALYILRNASSLEGMIGLRFEFWNLQNGNASLYINRQLGFVSVENTSGDVADVNHVGIGARLREGRFRNSYIEVGKGTNDLFPSNSGSRFKLNARIVAKLGDETSDKFKLFKKGYFFAHIVADVDGHEGPDAVQTYVGLAFCPWGSGRCSGGY